MEYLSASILLSVTVFIVLYVFVQAISYKVDLLSTRNLFLAGLVIFQATGPAFGILLHGRSSFQPADIPHTSILYTGMLLTFLTVFLVIYMRSTKIIDRIFAHRGQANLHYADSAIFIIAITTIPLGTLCQFVLSEIPVLGPGFKMLAYGLFSVAVGLASWVWFRRFFNPLVFLLASCIILFAMALTFQKNFGRRELLGIVMVIGWAAYYSRWRYLGLGRVLVRGFIVGGLGFFLLALVTSAREGHFKVQSAMQNISSLKDASFAPGAMDLITGQGAGLISMWLIESRPESHPYDTLHSVRLVLTLPIPRSYWLEKPDALGITMVNKEQKIPGMPPGGNVGPGLMGHIVNDNPWLALWMYPIFFGLFFRVLDRVVVWFPDNPFAVLPMGSALGQIIAIPRGEMGSFLFIALVNILGSLAIMFFISWILKIFGIIQKVETLPYGYAESAPVDDPYPVYADTRESY